MLEKTVGRLSGHGSSKRRARPETELVLTRWGKTNVFLKHLA
jgi:hypothetical protein